MAYRAKTFSEHPGACDRPRARPQVEGELRRLRPFAEKELADLAEAEAAREKAEAEAKAKAEAEAAAAKAKKEAEPTPQSRKHHGAERNGAVALRLDNLRATVLVLLSG